MVVKQLIIVILADSFIMSSTTPFLVFFRQATRLRSSYHNDPLRIKSFVSQLMNMPSVVMKRPFQVATIW